MKKKTVKKKYPSIKKNTTFLALWNYYRRMQRDFLKSVRRHRETKKSLEALKAEKGTPTSLKKAWKEELKRATAFKKHHRELVKDARRHVKKWLKAYLAWQEHGDKRGDLKAPAEAEKPKAKKAPKKASKPTASKKKPATKTAKKTSAKKAAPAPKPATKKAVKKTEKPGGKKSRPKKAPAQKKLAPTIRVARTIQVAAAAPAPKPAAKKPVKKAAHAAKPKPTTTAKRPARKPTAPKPKPAARPARPDNLKRVEGIGIKIEQLLKGKGIDSFEKLSKSTLKTLRGLLDAAGPHYRVSDPATWPKQARLAHQGKWEELKKWQGELKGGRIVK